MKKFSRCALILIMVVMMGAIGGYIFELNMIQPVYTSTAKIIVTPGEKNEATVRATDGGLVRDFEVVFKSNVVIEAAKKELGTTDNIAQYLTVATIPNSNIIEITVSNPDQATAKAYVDAIAKHAIKTTTLVTVEDMKILETGNQSNIITQPNLYRNAAIIAIIAGVICLIIELIILFVISAFKPEEDEDEMAKYQKMMSQYLQSQLMLPYAKEMESNNHRGGSMEGVDKSGGDDLDDLDDLEDPDKRFNDAIGFTSYKETMSKLSEADNTEEASEYAAPIENKVADTAVDSAATVKTTTVEEIIETRTEVQEVVSQPVKQPVEEMKSSAQIIGIIRK